MRCSLDICRHLSIRHHMLLLKKKNGYNIGEKKNRLARLPVGGLKDLEVRFEACGRFDGASTLPPGNIFFFPPVLCC